MREKDFQAWVIACAEQFGWLVKHVPAPMRATRSGQWVGAKEAAGLPDLIMLHDDPPRMILAEVKGTGGKLSDKQKQFLALARDVADVSVPQGNPLGIYAWFPEDQPIIERILRTRSLI